MGPGKCEGNQVPIHVPAGLTFRKLLQNAASFGGPALQRYDAGNANCQDFLLKVLQSSSLGDQRVRNFIKQDTKSIVGSIPGVAEKLGKVATDIAHKGDILLNGRGD